MKNSDKKEKEVITTESQFILPFELWETRRGKKVDGVAGRMMMYGNLSEKTCRELQEKCKFTRPGMWFKIDGKICHAEMTEIDENSASEANDSLHAPTTLFAAALANDSGALAQLHENFRSNEQETTTAFLRDQEHIRRMAREETEKLLKREDEARKQCQERIESVQKTTQQQLELTLLFTHEQMSKLQQILRGRIEAAVDQCEALDSLVSPIKAMFNAARDPEPPPPPGATFATWLGHFENSKIGSLLEELLQIYAIEKFAGKSTKKNKTTVDVDYKTVV